MIGGTSFATGNFWRFFSILGDLGMVSQGKAKKTVETKLAQKKNRFFPPNVLGLLRIAPIMNRVSSQIYLNWWQYVHKVISTAR